MGSAILRRLMVAAMTVLAGGLLSATLLRYAPGFGADERQFDARLSGESIQAIRNAHAEERNVISYFAGYLGRTLHGDLGTSRSLNQPVRQLLAQRMGVTCSLAGKGLAAAWVAAALLVFATWFVPTSGLRVFTGVCSGMLLCLPAGVLALLAIIFNGPAYLCIALIVFPKVHRYLGNVVSAAGAMPHIVTAHAKGISALRIVVWHVLPVIRREVLALLGVSISIAISAAIPVEALCGIPGVGQLAWQSALARDLPLLIDVSMLVIAFVVLLNSGADLLGEERVQPA
jgi:peptide/nickel transport system permease protein